MLVFVLIMSVVLNLLLENCVLPYFSVGGAVASTSIIIIICVSLFVRGYSGRILGIAIGLLEDIMFSQVIGVKALVYFTVGYISDELDRDYKTESLMETIILVIGATVFYNILYYLLMYVFFDIGSLLNFIKTKLWKEIIYNVVFLIPIYNIYKKIFKTRPLRFMRN